MRLIYFSLLLAVVPAVATAVQESYNCIAGAPALCFEPAATGAAFDFSSLTFSFDQQNMTGSITAGLVQQADSLSPAQPSDPDQPGDIFFFVNGHLRFGIALTPHSTGLLPGYLYQTDWKDVMTAADAAPGAASRPEFPVLLMGGREVGSGSVATQGGQLIVHFEMSPSFAAHVANGGMSVRWASTIDAGQVLVSDLPMEETPEPAAWATIGFGLLFLARHKLQDAAPTIRRVFWS